MDDSNRHYDLLQTAKSIQQDADATGLGRLQPKPDAGSNSEQSLLGQFDERVTNSIIRSVSRGLFADGHYAQAVESAFKAVNNTVKTKSGLTELDGVALMREAFSANNPKLRLNRFRSPSERNEQHGYMDLFAGAMAAIRNPRAHEHDLQDEPTLAIELLILANHLMRKLETAKRRRVRKAGP